MFLMFKMTQKNNRKKKCEYNCLPDFKCASRVKHSAAPDFASSV
jgi:hypothetical protein